ncbi:MAG: SGNH/GDSL hydrolase family protein [Sediminibacterium sp.]
MKHFYLISLMSLLLSATSFQPPTGKKVIFFGDSITEAAVKPGGYIRLMDSIISAANLSSQYELIGAGISGNKVYDLYLRLEKDVISKKPDIVVIYVGVNDVWHKATSGTGTDYAKFGSFYEALVNKLQEAGIQVIVCTPAVIGERTDFSNQQDGDLNLYSRWLRNFSITKKIPLVDLRNSFIQYNLANNPQNKESGILTTDRVHLNAKGNLLVASEIWKVIQNIP